MSDDRSEVRERLLEAWRGEIVAGAVYELIARRVRRPRWGQLRGKAGAGSGQVRVAGRATGSRWR